MCLLPSLILLHDQYELLREDSRYLSLATIYDYPNHDEGAIRFTMRAGTKKNVEGNVAVPAI